MRERRRGDWRIDLARRHPLESHVEEALDAHPALTRLAIVDDVDGSASTSRSSDPANGSANSNSKPSTRPTAGWTDLRPDVDEADLFILDELALRKIIGAGPYAILLINDQPSDLWVVFTTMDLVLAAESPRRPPPRHRRRPHQSQDPPGPQRLPPTPPDRHHGAVGSARRT